MLHSWGCGSVTPALGLAHCFGCQVACFLGVMGTDLAGRGLSRRVCYVSIVVVMVIV